MKDGFSMQKNNYLKVIVIFLFTINLILISSFFSKKNYSNIYSDVLNYKQDICDNEVEIYRDNKNSYLFSCVKTNFINIEFAEGNEFSLSNILNNKIYSIDELINMGLNITKKEIKEENVDNNNQNNKREDITPINNVIMTLEEINDYNKIIKSKTDTIYDLDNIDYMSKEEILKLINSYKLPSLPKYNQDIELTSENTKSILDNRNIDNVKDISNIQKGLITSRANLRSFPTNIHFYDKKNEGGFDRIQETELHINTEVIILHESLDGLWDFVISEIYTGWVMKDKIALASNEDINYFIYNDKFGIVIIPSINILNEILDMSVKLPLLESNFNNYKLVLPTRDIRGKVSRKEILISKDNISVGYLDYTKDNLFKMAKKYLGVSYSWGGMDYGVDCSSFIANIYRTFGFVFPRNTSSQSVSVGQIIDVANKTSEEKLNIMKEKEPALLYQNGHVMLYMGYYDNKYHVIHASGTGKVMESVLTKNSSDLQKINKIVLVNN